MKTNKLVSMLLVVTMIVSLLLPFGFSVKATADVIKGTVQAFNAAGNSGQIPSEEPEYSYWKTEFVEGNGTPWTTLRFVNKKTGLYLCEADGALIQTSDKDNAGTKFKVGDWYGSKWVLRTASDKVVGVDAKITSIDSGAAVGSDHTNDTVFNGEGYELVRFSVDGSYKTVDALTDGSYYVIYTKSPWGDWMNTCLTADPVKVPTEATTGTVQAFDAAGNSGQIPSEEPDYSYWKTEFVEGNGTPWTTLRFVNKKTGLYLCEADGALIQTSDKDNAGTKFKVGDWYGSKWVLRTASDKVVGVDAKITSIDSGAAVGSDHTNDTVFNGEGYELVRFSVDGSYKTVDALTDGSYYVIYTKSPWGDWMNTCLTADPVSTPPEVEQKFYEVKTIGTASEYSWWKFIASGSEYKIQNVETGYYLTNKEGTLALTNKADSDNELWKHVNNWGVTGHLQSKADSSWITVLGGSTSLLANASFSYQGTQSIRAFDKDGKDYHTTIPEAAAAGTALKICNRDDYDNGRGTYLTATTNEYKAVVPPTPVDPADAVAVKTTAYDVVTNGMPTTDKDKYLWRAFSTPEGWIFVNESNGLVLTDNGSALTAQSYIDEKFQYWTLKDNYGYKWVMYCNKGERYINTDGTMTSLGINQNSDEDHESDGINNFEWYEMIHFSEDGVEETVNILNGKAYYIYNVTGGESSTFKQLLGVTDQAAKTRLPIVPDTIMDGQDTANAPISISEPLAVKVTGLNAIKKEGSQIWIFRQVTVETPMKSLWDVCNGTTGEKPEVTTGFTIQNKETGLYLTQIGDQVYQDKQNGSASQIWVVEDYPFGHDDLKLVRSYGNGYQLVLEQSSYGLYNPNNWSNDKALQEEWPDLVKMNGGPVSGTATVCFARVTTDINEGEDIFPEDGKGYYIYNSAHGFGGPLLEAVSERVVDSTSDIPTISKDPYSKVFTYIADLEKGIAADDKNWDLLFDARVEDGKIIGSPSDESGIYGAAFRRRTSGVGTSDFNFKLLIPNYVDDYVSVALRLNDYYDIAADQTGLRIYINKDGRVGLKFAGTSETVTYVETGYSFTEGRNIYVSDNADTNTVTLYFDVNGTKTKIADFAINNGTVVMTPAADPANTITKFYGYNIYYDGFWSVTTSGYDVEISAIETVIPRFSKVAFDTDAETVIGGGDKTEKSDNDNTGGGDKPGDGGNNSGNNGGGDTGNNNGGNSNTGNTSGSNTSGNGNKQNDNTNAGNTTTDADNTSKDNEQKPDDKPDPSGDSDKKPDKDKDPSGQTGADDTEDSGISIWVPIAILGLGVLMAVLILLLALLKRRKDKEQ